MIAISNIAVGRGLAPAVFAVLCEQKRAWFVRDAEDVVPYTANLNFVEGDVLDTPL